MIEKTNLWGVGFWDATIKSWIELNSTYWQSASAQTLDRLTQFPPLGLHRGSALKLMQAFDAWAKLYPTSLAYQKVLIEIQIHAIEELIQTMAAKAEQGELLDWLQMQQLWGSIVDRVFEAAFATEDNLRVQGSFLNAVNRSKLCQQELIEVWLNWINLPTRSEIDEVHKNIYELRKEVKRLKQALAHSESQISASATQEFMQDRSNAV
jgi:polyhydroxyalkanoate synthase subunit PhaE